MTLSVGSEGPTVTLEDTDVGSSLVLSCNPNGDPMVRLHRGDSAVVLAVTSTESVAVLTDDGYQGVALRASDKTSELDMQRKTGGRVLVGADNAGASLDVLNQARLVVAELTTQDDGTGCLKVTGTNGLVKLP